MNRMTRNASIIVIPAQAGIPSYLRRGEELGPGLRRYDWVVQ
jgi:hypothetical protein